MIIKAEGKILIKSDVANNTIFHLSDAANDLDDDVTSKLNNSFQPLIDLGLASNCLGKIKEQVNSLLD